MVMVKVITRLAIQVATACRCEVVSVYVWVRIRPAQQIHVGDATWHVGPWCGYELYWQGGRMIRADGLHGGYNQAHGIMGRTESTDFMYLDSNVIYGGGEEVYENFHY